MKTRQKVALVINILICVPFFALGMVGVALFPLIALVVILNIVLAIYCTFTRFPFAGIGGMLGGIIAVITVPSGWDGFVIFGTFPFYCLIGMLLWIAGAYLFSFREYLPMDFVEKTEDSELSPLQKIQKNSQSDKKAWNKLSPEEQAEILTK